MGLRVFKLAHASHQGKEFFDYSEHAGGGHYWIGWGVS